MRKVVDVDDVYNVCRACDVSTEENQDLEVLDEHMAANYQALRDYEEHSVDVVVDFTRGSQRHARHLEQLLLVGQPKTARVLDRDFVTVGQTVLSQLRIRTTFTASWKIAMRSRSYTAVKGCTVYVK